MFGSIKLAPPDAILGLNEAFQKDPNPEKINLSVGVYKDISGKTPVLECVKHAEKLLVDQEHTKSYLGIDGAPEFGQFARELLLGASHPILANNRAVSVQTPGGTGALRVAADFVHRHFPSAKIWCSAPTWANHPTIFEAAGFAGETYSYFDPATNSLDFPKMEADIANIPAGDVVLLHGCCHNPCGVDPELDQWKKIAQLIKERDLLPFIDFAYQGFGDGIDQDAAGLRIVCDAVDEVLIASSFSKNFGLYRERVGALTVVTKTPDAATSVLSQLKRVVRTNYSNPPAHGAKVVETVLANTSLRSLWESELEAMRNRIHEMRELFVLQMSKAAPDRDFSFITRQRGMFSFSGLTRDQVNRLRNEFSIYIVGSGRINVAGITSENVDRLCQAIATVL